MNTTQTIYCAHSTGLRGIVTVSASTREREHKNGYIIDSFVVCDPNQRVERTELPVDQIPFWCQTLTETSGLPVEYKKYASSGKLKATYQFGF